MNKNSSSTNFLSPKDICDIIKTCREADVTKLSYIGLDISLNPRRNEDTAHLGPVAETIILPQPQPVTDDDARSIKMLDEQTQDDAELTQLMIDDPYAYEKLQISKDIERNRMIE